MNHRTTTLCRRNLRAYFAAFITYVMLAGQVAPLALAASRTAPPARPAAPSSAPPSKAAPRPAPLVFAAPNIVATKVDAWDDSLTPDGKAEPGQTITYTVTITNTGDADATGVTFSDSVDTHTTLVGGSVNTQPIAIADSYNVIGNVRIQIPDGANDLLANDRDPDTGNNTGLTASGPTTTTQGGNITINGDGSFTYNPAPGFNGTDTVTYTITDSGGKTDTAVATFLVGNGTSTPGPNVVWFINPAAPSGGDGRLTSPFNCYTGASPSCFSQTAADDPGDIIFIFPGSVTGGYALLANQKLIGAGATDTLVNLGGLTVPTGSDLLPTPDGNANGVTITTTNVNAIPLPSGAGNTPLLRGFTVGNVGTGTKISGTTFGTLTVGNSASPDVILSGTGQALNLSSGAFAPTSGFNGVATTSSASTGINLAGVSGTVSFGSTAVSGATTQGILIGTTTADINFGNTTVTATTDAVSFQNNSSGTRTFGTLGATAGGAGSAFLHGAGGGNVTVTGLATLQSGSGNTIDIQNQAASTAVAFNGGATLTKTAATNFGVNVNASAGTVTFGGTLTVGTNAARFPTAAVNILAGTGTVNLGTVSIFTNGFTGISTTTDGTLNSTGGTVDVNAATALNIAGPAGQTTLGMTLGTVNSSGGTNNVNVTNANGSLTLTGGSLSNSTGGPAFLVSGGNPTVSFGGTLSQSGAQRVVNVDGTTGNTVSFGGTVTATASSTGVLINNANGNVTFTTLNLGTAAARLTSDAVTMTNGAGTGAGTYTLGVATIFTNNAKGISATNIDGTINCSSTSTVNSSNGTAIDIDGPAGLTTLGMSLVSVNSAGGTADGIRLLDANGSFSVLGDGTNTSVGGNASGGTISGKSGADNNNTQGSGVYLDNVSNITLRRVAINGTNQNYGIRGNRVNNFTLEYSTVSGTNGTAASLPSPEVYGEGAVYFGNDTTSGASGTVTITNNTINGGRKRNFSFVNTAAGTTTLVAKGNTFGALQSFSDAGTSFAVEARVNSGVIINTTLGGTLAGEGNTLTSAPGDLVNFTGQDNTTMDVVMRNNTLTNNHPFNNSNGGGMTLATKGTMTFHVTGNTMRDANGSAVTLFKAAAASGTPSMSGFFDSNTIGVAAVANSGSATGNGIFVSAGGTGTMSYTITNNQIHQIKGNAHIYADNTGGSYTANFDIRGNLLDTPVIPGWAFGIGITNGAPTSSDTINVCAKIGGSTAADKNTLNLGGQLGVIVGSSGAAVGHTFNLPGYAGGANLTNVQNFIQANNTGSFTTSAYADAPATAAAFTGVGTGCGTPTSGANLVADGGDPILLDPDSIPAETGGVTTTRVPPTRGGVTSTPFVSTRPSTTVAPATRTTSVAATPARTTTTQTRTAAPATTRSTGSATTTTTAQTGGRSTSLTPVINGAGGTVSVNIGTLAPNDSVTITFQVVIDSVYTGGPNVSNQGTVSGTNFTTVNGVNTTPNTDDPSIAGAANATLTPILLTNIQVNDAKQAEPAAGTSQMLFTVTLSAPAPPGGLSVIYSTANGTATGGTSCNDPGADYITATNATLNIAGGSKVGVASITICSDAAAESDETLLLNISMPSSGAITDAQATGTITSANTPGTVLISEFRMRGPASTTDDFVELYNNTNSPITVPAGGYGLFKVGTDCNGTPALVGTVPAGTIIPARGHYLFVGSTYSLANYGGPGAAAGNATLTSDLGDDTSIALFSTTDPTLISTVNRLDAVGMGGNNGNVCELLHEGTNLHPVGSPSNVEFSWFRKECDFAGGCKASGNPKDTNENFDDFMFADTQGTFISGLEQHLGAPGPENLASPIRRDNAGVLVPLLDGTQPSSASPNRDRNFTPNPPAAPNGVLSVRRRVQNTTGATITRLRFRVIEMTTFPSPGGGIADLRLITSTPVVLSNIQDPTTCASTGTPTTVPCQVTAQATVLETPPAQPNGGGYNSTVSVTLPGPGLANNASIDVNFALGVVQGGTFRFIIIVEALP